MDSSYGKWIHPIGILLANGFRYSGMGVLDVRGLKRRKSFRMGKGGGGEIPIGWAVSTIGFKTF